MNGVLTGERAMMLPGYAGGTVTDPGASVTEQAHGRPRTRAYKRQSAQFRAQTSRRSDSVGTRISGDSPFSRGNLSIVSLKRARGGATKPRAQAAHRRALCGGVGTHLYPSRP